MHTHEWYCISSALRQKEKKKKDQPTDPPGFWAERANKLFIFLGLSEDFDHKNLSETNANDLWNEFKDRVQKSVEKNVPSKIGIEQDHLG